MKYFILLFAICCSTSLIAQVTAASDINFDETTTYANQLTIKAAPDRVVELWDQFWDDKYDVDVDRVDRNRDREVYNAKAVMVPAISSKQVDLYSKITTSSETEATVSLGVGLGYDIYATPDNYNSEFEAARAIMGEFETYFYRTYYQAQLETVQEAFDDVQDDASDLKNDLEKSDRRIQRWTSKIEDERKETAETRSELQKKQMTLSQKEAQLEMVKRKLAQWEG